MRRYGSGYPLKHLYTLISNARLWKHRSLHSEITTKFKFTQTVFMIWGIFG